MFIFLVTIAGIHYKRVVWGLKMCLDRSIYIAKDKLPAKITVKKQLRILSDIKDNLEDWELEIFMASCFRHFLDLDR